MTPQEERVLRLRQLQFRQGPQQQQPPAPPVALPLDAQRPMDQQPDPAPVQMTPQPQIQQRPPVPEDIGQSMANAAGARSRADQLEAQINPPQPKQSLMQTIGQGALTGIRSMSYPGGYDAYKNAQDVKEHQRQQDLVARAQQARELGVQGDQTTQQLRNYGLQQDQNAASQANIASEIRQRQRAKAGSGAGGETYITDPGEGTNYTPGQIMNKGDYKPPTTPQLSKETVMPKPDLAKELGIDPSKPIDVMQNLQQGPNGPTGDQFYQTPQGNVKVTGRVTHWDKPSPYPEPPVTSYNPDVNANVITPRSDLASYKGTGTTLAPLAETTLASSRETDSTFARLTKIGQDYRDEFVGPGLGRVNELKTMLPEGTPFHLADLPTGYTDFAPQQAALTNDFIKFMTGAQMSESEAKRLSLQVPQGTDRGDVWKGKYDTMMKRVRIAKSLMDRHTAPPAGGWTAADIDRMVAESEQRSPTPQAGGGAQPVTSLGGGPKVGTVEDGHVFMGGDPANQKNWKKQ